VFKIFISHYDVDDSISLFNILNNDIKNHLDVLYANLANTVYNSEETDIDISLAMASLAEHLLSLVESFEDVFPLYHCKNVNDVYDVINNIKINPKSLGGQIINPYIINTLTNGKPFTKYTKHKFINIANEILTPLTSITEKNPIYNNFSKLSPIDVKNDMEVLSDISVNISDDSFIYIIDC
jgi:hypothetical protein